MLPADISRCTGINCPHRDYCLRFTSKAVPDQNWLAHFNPPPGVETGAICSEFLPAIAYGDNCIMTPERASNLTDRRKM